MAKCQTCRVELSAFTVEPESTQDSGFRMKHPSKQAKERCERMKTKPMCRRYFDPDKQAWVTRSSWS